MYNWLPWYTFILRIDYVGRLKFKKVIYFMKILLYIFRYIFMYDVQVLDVVGQDPVALGDGHARGVDEALCPAPSLDHATNEVIGIQDQV